MLLRPTAAFLLSSLLILPFLSAAGPEDKVKVGTPPSWVVANTYDADYMVPPGEASNGLYSLLIDTQINLATRERHARSVKRVLNTSGVQNGSQLEVLFYPDYQTLTVHAAKVIRKGGAVDQLDRGKIRLIHKEEEADHRIYDNAMLAQLHLEDVRPGDIIELSYTIKGVNPILGPHYAEAFSLEWAVPVDRSLIRILRPRGMPLEHRVYQFQDLREDLEGQGGLLESRWGYTRLPGRLSEDELPSWHYAWGWMQISQYRDWGEVVGWALPLYGTGQELPREARERVEEWKTSLPDKASRVEAALRFVQNDVRYLSMSMGAGSYRPRPVAETLRTRFGDCKDKALLLVALLRAMDIGADPALVNTEYRHRLREFLPSHGMFDHVIVRVVVDGRSYWVDPTRNLQGGTLGNIYLPDYRAALVLAPGEANLTEIPPVTAANRISHREVYRQEAYGRPVMLTSESVYEGVEADHVRDILETTSRAEMGKNQLNYYARIHKDLEPRGEMRVEDDQKANRISISRDYELTNPWRPSDDGSRLLWGFFAKEIHNRLQVPDDRIRSMPLGLEKPLHIQVVKEVQLPEDFQIENYDKSVVHPSFRFERKVRYADRRLVLTYDYRNDKDSVDADQMKDYLARVESVQDELSYELGRSAAAEDSEAAGRGADEESGASTGLVETFWAERSSVHWTLWALTLVTLAGSALLFAALYPTRPSLPVDGPGEGPSGLGGWLLLVGLGLFVRPVMMLIELGRVLHVADLRTFVERGSPSSPEFHPLWVPYLIYCTVGLPFLVAFSGFLIVLFFARRRSFPFYFCLSLVFMVFFKVLGVAQMAIIHGAVMPWNQFLPAVTGGLLGGVLWIVYMFRSKRVRNTFVR